MRETRALAGRALPSMNKTRNKGDQRGADMVRPYAQNQKGNPCRATALLTALQFLGFDFKKKKKIESWAWTKREGPRDSVRFEVWS